MPIDERMSAIADDPFLPLFGPFRYCRNFHAAACLSLLALPLTMVSQEYDTLLGPEPLGPTGIGAVAMSLKREPIACLSELSHQLAMMIIAVRPPAKLSRYGPVVLAFAVPIDGSVTLYL